MVRTPILSNNMVISVCQHIVYCEVTYNRACIGSGVSTSLYPGRKLSPVHPPLSTNVCVVSPYWNVFKCYRTMYILYTGMYSSVTVQCTYCTLECIQVLPYNVHIGIYTGMYCNVYFTS